MYKAHKSLLADLLPGSKSRMLALQQGMCNRATEVLSFSRLLHTSAEFFDLAVDDDEAPAVKLGALL